MRGKSGKKIMNIYRHINPQSVALYRLRVLHTISIKRSRPEKNIFFVPDLTHSHTLRHTGCTRLGENNVNPKVMQYVMGHSDAQITMNVYNHIAEKSHVENEMSKMNLPGTVPAVV